MSRRQEVAVTVSLLGKASQWLAHTLTHVVRMEAQLAAVEPGRRDKVEDEGYGRFKDAERRLMLALEAYGELVGGGDVVRAEAVI